jgi:hypothetical protein
MRVSVTPVSERRPLDKSQVRSLRAPAKRGDA